jgi:hypothetical protein
MPQPKFRLIAPVFGAAIAIYGGIANIACAENRIPSSAELSSARVSEANRFVPQKVLMVLTIPMDGKAWSQLDRFHTPKTKKIFDRAIAEFLKVAFPKNSFAQEIQPWMGNITMAVFPGSAGSRTKRDSKYGLFLAIEIKDRTALDKYLESEKVRDGGSVEKRTYKGLEIIQIDYGNGSLSVYTITDRFLVYAEKISSLERIIDTYKVGKSIVPTLVADADKVEIENPIFQLYMPSFGESIEQLLALSQDPTQIPSESLAQIKKIKSFNVSIGIDDAGIRMKVVSRVSSDVAWENKPAPGKVISQFPIDTFALISGGSINNQWQRFNRDITKIPELKKFEDVLDEVRGSLKSSPLNLDLDKDIFGWMDGEFAFGVIPVKEGILSEFGAAPVFIQQTSDRRAANSLIQKLEKLVKDYGIVTIATQNIKGISVTQWTFPGAPEPMVSYGWSGNMLFITIGEQLVKRMTDQFSDSLAISSDFQAAIASLSKPNLGYFYLEMDKTWALINKYLPDETKSQITPEATAILGRIRGLGIATTTLSPLTYRMEVLLSLKQRGLRNVWY